MPRLRAITLLLLATFSLPALAGGVNKDMIQLQAQIQQLQEAVARLQQSNDERMGVLKDLVQQSADSVNRMSLNIDTLQRQLVAQQAAASTKEDQLVGQVQSLNDTLDEIKARMNRLEKTLNDVQSSQQTLSANLQNLPQASQQPVFMQPTSTPPSSDLASRLAPVPALGRSGKPSAAIPATPLPSAATPLAAAPVEDLYKAAFSDYMAAKYPVAAAEFNDVIKTYPDHQLSGNSFYYLGEIDFRTGKYSAAARDYDKVLEQFPDSNKIPAAHLHKGQALIEMKQTEAGVREFRTLIQRFPNSPEAASARSKLNGLGITLKPRQ